MLFKELFDRFLEQSPICVMARGLMERALATPSLNALFEKTAQRQYTRELLFSTTVDVMALVVSGLLNKQVGGELGISEITVKAHRGQVMRKMKAESLPALVMMATRLGMAEARITLRGAVSLVVPFARVLTPSDQQRSSTRGC